jgi:hypothetical protein
MKIPGLILSRPLAFFEAKRLDPISVLFIEPKRLYFFACCLNQRSPAAGMPGGLAALIF